MATYGKKRHILPVLSAPRDFGAGADSKRPRPIIQGSLPYNTSGTLNTETNWSPALSRRDSIDEMADNLLEDTIMEECHVDRAATTLSDGVDMSDNRPSKSFANPKCDHTPLAPHGSSQRNLTGVNFLEEAKLEDGRVEETSLTIATRASSFSPVQHGISKSKSLAYNIADTNSNMAAMAKTAGDFKPDDANSYSYTPYSQVSNRHLAMTDNLDEEAKIDYQHNCKSKQTNYIENTGSHLAHHGALQAKPSAFNAADVNSKIEAMMAATKTLKPDAINYLRPGQYTTAKARGVKDGNVLTKMKTAMNHHFQGHANKKSPEPAETSNSEKTIRQSALTTMEIRMNEGDNLKNPKIVGLTGHGKIRRKPLPDGGKSLRSQNSSSSQLARSKSEPILELSSDNPSNSVEPLGSENATEPFPLYDTDYDMAFSSSPIAQSTPRIRVQPPFEEGVDSRSSSDQEFTGVSGSHSDMDLDTREIEKADVVKKKTPQSKGARSSVRSTHVGRMKKHPSPSKADLEKWEQILTHFPATDDSESHSQVYNNYGINVYFHPKSSVLHPKPTNFKLQEPTRKQDKSQGGGMFHLQVPDDAKTSATMDDAPSRRKDRVSSVTKHRSSKTRSREGTRSGRSFSSNVLKEDNPMDIDELQLDQPCLLRKAT